MRIDRIIQCKVVFVKALLYNSFTENVMHPYVRMVMRTFLPVKRFAYEHRGQFLKVQLIKFK